MSPHVFLVAGEESGDRLGAALIAAIKRRTQSRARFSGVGGTHMAQEGVQSLFPLGDLAIMGFAAIPASLPKILRHIRETADVVIAARPDVLVIIDSPEFTHRVARRVRKIAPKIPIVDYVCPSVWAWRPGRARAMRAYVDHVLALLPFEPAAMQRLDGPLCTFVGHPLSERVDQMRPSAEEARRRLGDPPRLLVLPGSRSGEIRRMAGVFGDTVALVVNRIGTIDVVVPAVPRLADAVAAAISSWRVPTRIVTEQGDKDTAFRTARAALTKSGTSTLELAVAGVPMVAAYKVPLLEEMIGRMLITAPSAILTNLVLGENVVPEFLQR
ncbi:MAG: lipid-A-disaccharide synthase, partial [Pseudolabrys sp.]|nr:lipid-A-disaccharide synthase [Pseudolabrys sp.]